MPHLITGEVAKGLCALCANSCEPKGWLGDPCTVPSHAELENMEVVKCSRFSDSLRSNISEETKK